MYVHPLLQCNGKDSMNNWMWGKEMDSWQRSQTDDLDCKACMQLWAIYTMDGTGRWPTWRLVDMEWIWNGNEWKRASTNLKVGWYGMDLSGVELKSSDERIIYIYWKSAQNWRRLDDYVILPGCETWSTGYIVLQAQTSKKYQLVDLWINYSYEISRTGIYFYFM